MSAPPTREDHLWEISAWVHVTQPYLDLCAAVHSEFASLSWGADTEHGLVEYHHLFAKCSVWPRKSISAVEEKHVNGLRALLTLRVRRPGEIVVTTMYVRQQCIHMPKKLHGTAHALLFCDNPQHHRLGFAAVMMMGMEVAGPGLWQCFKARQPYTRVFG